MISMNLLYTVFMRENSRAKGVLQKVIGQCNAFSKTFNNVYLYISRDKEAVLYSIADGVTKEVETFKYKKYSTFSAKSRIKYLRGYFWYKSFLNYLEKIIDSYQIDILYYRNSLPVNKLMKIMKDKKVIKILEIPTYPYENEVKGFSEKIQYTFFWKNGQQKMIDLADIVVAIPGAADLKVDEKFVLINNGIQLENIKMKRHIRKDSITFLSVANVAFWHGYDRILRGIYDYYRGNPKREVYYNCVGDGPELTNLKKLTKELSLEKYVIFHGTKTGEDLDKVVDECDIAFGSLGNHRKGLYADSALKNREYCARGIPFVIASEDQDFPESFPFVFRVPPDESPIDIDKVIQWYENLSMKHPDFSAQMRKYAEENLSWDAKMRPVINRINSIAELENVKSYIQSVER